MLRHSKSLLLVWKISEFEAINLGQETLDPAHFFLGILKTVEANLSLVVKNQKRHEAEEIEDDISQLKVCVGEYVPDLAHARRFLRSILPSNDKKKTLIKCRRSKTSRIIFSEAEKVAEKNQSPVLPTHLLMVLIKSGNAQITTVLEKYKVDLAEFQGFMAGAILKSRKYADTFKG